MQNPPTDGETPTNDAPRQLDSLGLARLEQLVGPSTRMLSTPGNPEQSDILLQEIGRLSEQQRAAAHLLNVANFRQSAQLLSAQLAAVSSTPTSQNFGLPSTSSFSLPFNNFALQQLAAQLSAVSPPRPITPPPVIVPPELAMNTLQWHQNHDSSYPMMLQRDNNTSALSMFAVGRHKIVGFIVGGEPRLCLPQLKALILPEIQDLYSLLDILQIATANASADQLSQLIRSNSLPSAVAVCPLISRSNAEKLLNYCVIHGIRPLNGLDNVDNFLDPVCRRKLESEILKIEHFCFGGQRGRYFPSLLGSSCIECVDCNRLFAPPDFVRHAHQFGEPTTCDWGFDPANWRFYIALDPDQPFTDNTEFQVQQLLATIYGPPSELEPGGAPSTSTLSQQMIAPLLQQYGLSAEAPRPERMEIDSSTEPVQSSSRYLNDSMVTEPSDRNAAPSTSGLTSASQRTDSSSTAPPVETLS